MARPKKFDEEAVLDRAVNLFWCRGYEATSVQDLVEGLGIHRASLYDTFGDKYALYRRALDRYRQTKQTSLCALMTQDRPAFIILRDMFSSAIRESLDDTDHKGCFMVNSAVELAAHDPDVARVVADNQRNFEAQLTELIERGQREGDVATTHPAADLARFVYVTFNSLQVLGKLQPEPAVLDSVVNVVFAALRA